MTRERKKKKPWQLLSVSPSVPLSEPSLPAAPPNFRGPKESRLSGTLRFDSHRELEILIASACLIPLQKRVSRNKDMSINTQDSSEVVCTESFRAVSHSNIPKTPQRHGEGPGPRPALSTTLMSLHIMSAITHTVRVLSPLSLAHLMCSFSVLLTCDTTDLNPMTEPFYFSHMHRTTQCVLTVYIVGRWHLNIRAVVLGHCGCMDRRRVSMVTQTALELLFYMRSPGPFSCHRVPLPK